MDCVFHRHLRCITKPFKRWAFAMGVAYTLEHSLAYGNKYLLKYVRKRRKMASQMALHAPQDGLADGPAAARAQMRLSEASEDNTLIRALANQLVSTDKTTDKNDLRASLAEGIRAHLQGEGIMIDADARVWVHEYTEYALGLGEVLEKNKGLDHSKVREYWLARGPRLLLTALIYLIFLIICQEFLKGDGASRDDRAYTVVVNIMAFFIAVWLLYRRLGDAIEGVVARSSHDFYVLHKKTDFKQLAAPPEYEPPQSPLQRSMHAELRGATGRPGDWGLSRNKSLADMDKAPEEPHVPAREGIVVKKVAGGGGRGSKSEVEEGSGVGSIMAGRGVGVREPKAVAAAVCRGGTVVEGGADARARALIGTGGAALDSQSTLYSGTNSQTYSLVSLSIEYPRVLTFENILGTPTSSRSSSLSPSSFPSLPPPPLHPPEGSKWGVPSRAPRQKCCGPWRARRLSEPLREKTRG